MTRKAVLIGHSDADGHVLAEQVRRNLEGVHSFHVTTVIDPARTAGHKAWLHLDAIPEIEKGDLVFFVDLMFAPTSCAAEADALVKFAKDRPAKRFFVLDHHPLPLGRLSAAPNIRAIYRDDVLDCTIGPSSEMMVIAALCETQWTRATETSTASQKLIAKGIKRAAAIGGTLPGAKLSALLRFDYWRELEMLGREDVSQHRRPRGYRAKDNAPSETLAQLDKTATALLASAPPRHHPTVTPMSYDFDAVKSTDAPKVSTPVPHPKDLEAIVMLLELAAIYLTPEPGTVFTVEQLVDQARSIGGDALAIDEKDAFIVLEKASFLKKESGKKLRLR